MQVGMVVDEQLNLVIPFDNDGEDVTAGDESPILLRCRQIIDNTGEKWVRILAKDLKIHTPSFGKEDDWDRSKYLCIKSQLADRFSPLGIEGVELLESVITNDNYTEVHTLLVDAGLIELKSDFYIQSKNSNDDDILSSEEKEVADQDNGNIGSIGGIGSIGDNSLLFKPLSLSEHDQQPVENNEVGNIENVNPGEQFGDGDILGDISVHSPKAVVPTRNTSPNEVTDTIQFDDVQLAASAGCGYIIYQDEEVPTRPLPQLPPVRGVDPNIQQRHCFSHENGMLIIPLPQLKQSGNRRMHPTAKEIVKEYSLRALDIVKTHNHYLDICSPTFSLHMFTLHYEKNGLKQSAAVYGVWRLFDGVWVLDKIGCALKLLGRIATYPSDADYKIQVLVDMDAIPQPVQKLLQQNTKEMIAELACPSNVVHEPLRLFCKKLLGTVGIDAGIGRSTTLQTIENGVAYDVKASDAKDKVSILAEFARWDVELHETMSDEVVAAADSFMRLPELQRFRDEGPKRGIIARALLNWASGKRDDQQSSHVVHTEAVGVSSSNIRDALQPRFAGVGGGTLRYDSNYSPEELQVGAREYSIELKECIQLALEGKLVLCLLNFWYKYFTWNQLVHIITSIHLEVEETSSLNVGFKIIAEVFKSPSATNWNQLPGELVYFCLNLPGGGSVLACVNKSFCSAADATNKIDDRTALFTAIAQEFVSSTLSEMRGETVTHHKCIQAVHEKLKVQEDLHLGKIIAAAFSRYSVGNVDSFLTCGSGRSKYWTTQAQKQARGEIPMSSLNSNGKRSILGNGSNSVSWYGMIAFTQGGTVSKCFGTLATYCAESNNPALCWKKVLADLYGCDWYLILKRIAELAYDITLPSGEAQQARLDQRQAKYEEKLRLTRATSANHDKRKVYVLPEIPQEPSVSLEYY